MGPGNLQAATGAQEQPVPIAEPMAIIRADCAPSPCEAFPFKVNGHLWGGLSVLIRAAEVCGSVR